MKIIDLLNKIANGEIPQKIRINRWLYTHNGIDYTNERGEYLFNTYLETTTKDMNMEVEIIEEDKKIEKLENEIEFYSYSKYEELKKDVDKIIYILKAINLTENKINNLNNKLNEIIDKVNSLENKQ